MANCNFKVILKDIQNKYKFKIFCTGNGNLSNYYTKNETDALLENKVNTSDLSTVATSGSYNDLSNKPSIPNKTSDLTNDSNFEVNTNKVTSISSSSTDTQYPSAKAVYDSQDAQDTQISNLQEENDYLTSIINQLPKVTGEGTDLTLNNTLNAKLDLDLKGNTTQYTTTGKNICDGISQGYWLSQNVTLGGKSTTDSGEVINVQGGSYTISTKATQTRYRVGLTNTLSTSDITVSSGVNKDGTSDNITINTTGYFYLIINATDLTKIQVEQGSSATTFEEYTGGMPSPNPDYPQDIKVVTGNNTITIANSNDTISQSYLVNLGTMELCKIGTYQDRIYKSNGNWYLHKEVGKVVLDGSENYTYDSTYTRFYTQLGFSYDTTIRQQFPCNLYTNEDSTTAGHFGTNVGGKLLYFHTPNSSITTTTGFQNWVSSNNLIIYVVLATPTETQITDTTLISQLNALEKALAYQNQTNISQTNADKPFIIDASTIYDLSNLVTRVAVLETE